MNKIELYVDSLYKHMDKNSNEVRELKKEMRNHLLETVNELKSEGKNEEESIEIAIKRFGKPNQLENEISEVLKVKRKFAKGLSLVTLACLLLSIICFISYKVVEDKSSLGVPKNLKASVEEKIKIGEEISNEEVSKSLLNYKKQFRYVALYKEKNYNSPDIIYPSNFSLKQIKSDESTLTTSLSSPDGTMWRITYGFNADGFNFYLAPIMLDISVFLFAAYWILFGIWCVKNAHCRNKLSLSWIILFFTLNVLAYAIFKLDIKRIKNTNYIDSYIKYQ